MSEYYVYLAMACMAAPNVSVGKECTEAKGYQHVYVHSHGNRSRREFTTEVGVNLQSKCVEVSLRYSSNRLLENGLAERWALR